MEEPSVNKSSSESYRIIFDACPDPILIVGNGSIITANPAMQQMMGHEFTIELINQDFLAMVEPHHRSAVLEYMTDLAEETDRSTTLDFSMLGVNGDHIPVEANATLLAALPTRPILLSLRDRRAQEEKELQFDQRRARSAHVDRLKMLGELAAGVVHNFNNILTTMEGRISRLLSREHNAAPDTQEDLEVLSFSVRQAGELTERIKDFAKPNSDEGFSEVDIADLALKTASMVKTKIPNHVNFQTDIHPVEKIRGDFSQLLEVTLNLVHNAIDAVGEMGQVTLATYQDQREIILEVRDDGEGVPEEIQKKIFQPFFSTKGKEGTGLGLSVSQWILRKHDAQIQLHSEQGQGTQFRLVFPQATQEADKKRQLPSGALSILILDDDPNVAQLMADLLETLGHKPSISHSHQEAKAMLTTHQTDLFLTDLELPDASGWDVARIAREDNLDIVVGVVTGWPLSEEEIQRRLKTVDLILAKPFTIAALKNGIENLRDNQS